jgi:RecA/RadA recombinase
MLHATSEVPQTKLHPAAGIQMRYLPTGMLSLDQCLLGGIRIGTITEFVGRAGTGKTQLALQLCVMAARYNQGAVYIDTEKKVSLRRLQEISTKRASAFQGDNSSDYGSGFLSAQGNNFSYGMSASLDVVSQAHEQFHDDTVKDFPYKSAQLVLANLTVHCPTSTEELLSVLDATEEEILHRNQESTNSTTNQFPVRLLIVDSIAAPTRRDFGTDSAPQRAAAVFKCAQTLKRLADQLHLAVVVINQVGLETENRWNTGTSKEATVGSDQVSVRAALGTSWHHCVSTRMLMEHERDPHRVNRPEDNRQNEHVDGELERGRVRRLTLVKSNVAGLSSTSFEVTSIGLAAVQIPAPPRDEMD